MSKKMLIDATHAEETRVVVVDGQKVDEFDFESENRRQLSGNIYLAKVTRVEPSLQAAFVDYGGNRHGFLAFSEIHPDYYQIPVADREALLAEEAELARAEAEEEDAPKKRSRSRSRSKAAKTQSKDAVVTEEVAAEDTGGAEAAATEGDTPAAPTESDTASEMEADARTAEIARDVPGMDVIDLTPDPEEVSELASEDEKEYVAADTAAENDETVEDVADADVSEEIRPRRKSRARRYKIQEVIKVRQVLLVQVVKEERGNKGAALTTYLSLAGRYCVLMPNTARGGGISRKITQAADRKKLKEIASEIDVPQGAGLIIRTAGAKRTKTEIKRDYEYLQRLWEQIRDLTLKSIAPAKIYEEGNLIKRSIRDLYSREIDEVMVEGEVGYRTAKDFMKMIMPSHAKNVKHYTDSMPLFARFQVESYLGAMFNPTVQLKSGGYIVIGITEALVAIDVNSGKATKRGSIEETAFETNLEAAEEIARQLRLRDLAGLIVIDFIDMEERKNNAAVEKRFKDKLKNDRARIQVGRISAFGLMEMSRQRLRPGMLEASTQPCPACHGTGLIRSDDSVGLTILRQIEEEGTRNRSREVLVKAPVQIANFLMNMKREHIAQIESRYGMAVRIEGDPFLVAPDFSIEKFKTATRVVEAAAPVVSGDASLMAEIDEDTDAEPDLIEAPETRDEEGAPKKKRRRRRRRSKSSSYRSDASTETGGEAQKEETSTEPQPEGETVAAGASDEATAAPAEAVEVEAIPPKPKKKSTRSSSKSKSKPKAKNADVKETVSEETDAAEAEVEEKPKRSTRSRTSRKKATDDQVADTVSPTTEEAPAQADEPAAVEPVAEAPAKIDAPKPEPILEEATASDEGKPRRKGWWSLGR